MDILVSASQCPMEWQCLVRHSPQSRVTLYFFMEYFLVILCCTCPDKRPSDSISNSTFFMNSNFSKLLFLFFISNPVGKLCSGSWTPGIVSFCFVAAHERQSTHSDAFSWSRSPHWLGVSPTFFTSGTLLYKCLLRNYHIMEFLRFLQHSVKIEINKKEIPLHGPITLESC